MNFLIYPTHSPVKNHYISLGLLDFYRVIKELAEELFLSFSMCWIKDTLYQFYCM